MPRKLGYVLPSSPSDNSVIDHQFYPHIIDEIFHHAEAISVSHLLTLRTAGPAWRERVDRRMAYHLIMKGNMVPIEAHSGILRCRLMTVTEENLEEAKKLAPSWARFVRVIDVDATSKHKDLCELLTAWKVDHYETLRFTSGPPVYGKWSMLCEQPTRTVYLQSPPYTPTGHFEGVRKKKIDHLVASPRFMGRAPGKVVVHQTSAAPENQVSTLFPLFFVEPALVGLGHVPLVVMFHQWGDSATGNLSDNYGRAFSGNFGETFRRIDWSSNSWRHDHDSVVVVGFEKLSATSIGLGKFNVPQDKLQYIFREMLKNSWENRHRKNLETEEGSYDDSDVSDGEDDALKPMFGVKFKTNEVYRAGLARADFEIETSAVITTMAYEWPYSDKAAKATQRSASKSKPA